MNEGNYLIKEKPKVIIAKAKELNLYDIVPVKLWVKGTHMRRTLSRGTPDAADLVTDYLTRNDEKHMIGVKKKITGKSIFYHLAPNLKLFAEVHVQLAMGWRALPSYDPYNGPYDPDNFPTEMRFHTRNQQHIKDIVKGINYMWEGSGQGLMLDNMNYKKYRKKFKVTPEEIQKAWQKWSEI